MKLVDPHKSFELKIRGYEFEKSSSYHDMNWLTVFIDVSVNGVSWQAEDNCLLAYELEALKEWLGKVNDKPWSEIMFTENEICFEYDKKSEVLTIVLDFNFHPKGKEYDYQGGEEECRLSFVMDERKLDALKMDIRRLLKKYPVRLAL
ncbi:MAG: hypothetical protein KZQ86_07685 [Candidatus Thiodiazotropha sp. (ex Lucinoma kastoroae)]|nr:hypothetical protein [Candidatus Thiodiazotropha sp. (ex Lucinoma kastoroae)]